jgi:hypothetical protein
MQQELIVCLLAGKPTLMVLVQKEIALIREG